MSSPPETGTSPRRTDSSTDAPNVRHIPIFVEGRDRPVVNYDVDSATKFPEPARTALPDEDDFFKNREQSSAFRDQPSAFRDRSGFRAPSHFAKAFGDPFNGFGGSPFRNMKSSPFRPQPKPDRDPPPPDERPRDGTDGRERSPRPERAPKAASPSPRRESSPAPEAPQAPPAAPQAAPTPPPPEQCKNLNDPISKIQSIQREVLDLMTKVESFRGTKKDKEYIYLDEMLTRNLIKLDDVDTEGKENIRLARKEAIKCIQKCIAVMEAKAESVAAELRRSESTNPPKPETDDSKSDGNVERSDSRGKNDSRTEDQSATNRLSAYENVNRESGEGSESMNGSEAAPMDIEQSSSSTAVSGH